MILTYVVAAEAALAFLLTLPAPKLLKNQFVSLVSLILQPALFIVPFAGFQLLDIYWKNEHRLSCTSEICTAAERDRYEKSLVAASKGYEDITRFLIDQGADAEISDKFGNTPLLEAIKNGHDKVASLLVKAGASLTIDDAGEFLCITVARRNLDLLKRLLANDINPNAKNYDQRTALHVAASEGLYPMAEFLLEAGASVLSKDRWGSTPLDEARIGGNKKLIELLKVARASQLSEFSDQYHQETT